MSVLTPVFITSSKYALGDCFPNELAKFLGERGLVARNHFVKQSNDPGLRLLIHVVSKPSTEHVLNFQIGYAG